MKIKLTKPYTAREIEKITGAFIGSDIRPDQTLDAIATHSDEVEKNTLFLAFRGERTDGTRFYEAVTERGGYIMSEKRHARGFTVSSVQDALFRMAEAHLASLRQRKSTVCITGSTGKTTTKEILFRILSPHLCVHATKGNQNSEIGLPLTVLSAPEDTEILLLEAGMNHAGELARLSYLARPDLAIITNVGYAHVGNLGSREAIAAAKKEILLGKKENASVLIPAAEALLSDVADQRTVALFGEEADFTLTEENGDPIFKERGGAHLAFPQGMTDLAMRSASAFAAAAALLLGIQASSIEKEISSFRHNIFRQNIINKNGMEIVFDAYNASPESVLNAIFSLCRRRDERPCALVLGDMKELGAHADAMHRRIASALSEQRGDMDLLFLFGESAEAIAEYAKESGFPADRIFINPDTDCPEATANEILKRKRDGMRVVLKGARKMRMERILCLLTVEKDGDHNA